MFNKTRYDVEYSKTNVTRLFLSFNRNNPADMEILKYAREQGNVTAYVKMLIRADMERNGYDSVSLPLSKVDYNPHEY